LFYERVKTICEKHKKVLFFIDMDGSIVEFDFFTKEFREKNQDGLFLNLRPLTSIIKCLEKINEIPNIELYILSICRYNDDAIQKIKWLDRYVPFLKNENRFILTRENGDYDIETKYDVKGEFIKKMLKEDEYAIFLEDTHDNMKKARDLLGDQITNFHISSLIE